MPVVGLPSVHGAPAVNFSGSGGADSKGGDGVLLGGYLFACTHLIIAHICGVILCRTLRSY